LFLSSVVPVHPELELAPELKNRPLGGRFEGALGVVRA
jgi:hypothetical protein